MSSTVTLKALGLNTQINQLESPPGSMSTASNIIIRRDDVIESRRGFKLYGESFGTSTDFASQLLVYKGRILRHYNDILSYDTGTLNSDGQSIFNDFAGAFSEVVAGLRIKSVEANGNLYFTSSNGIQRVSANSASQFTTDSGFITNAGGVKALDVSTSLDISLGNQVGFLPTDSTVAYRILWGLVDNNNTTITGTPSQRSVIYNSLLQMVIRDEGYLLSQLDKLGTAATSLITDTNYFDTYNLTLNSSADDLKTSLLGLATKLDNDILYANGTGSGVPLTISGGSPPAISGGICTVTFSSGNPTTYLQIGSKIYLAGFTTGTSGSINGVQTVASVTSNTITFATAATGTVTVSSPTIVSYIYRNITQPGTIDTPPTHDELVSLQEYLQSILTNLQNSLSGVISPSDITTYLDPVSITTSANVDVNFTIPESITASYFYQIYRSDTKTATSTDVLADLLPDDEMKLVYESFPTTAELAAGQITVLDSTPDAFIQGSTFLYTNEISGEGILQANDLPPLAKDINRFKNYIFYANTSTLQRLSITMLGVTNILADYNTSKNPKLVVTDGSTTNEYSFIKGIQQVASLGPGAGSTYNSSSTASYLTIYDGSNNPFYIWIKRGTATDPALSGFTGIEVDITGSETVAQMCNKISDAVGLFPDSFTSVFTSTHVTITNVNEGYAETINVVNSMPGGFTYTFSTTGQGERLAKQSQRLTCVADVSGSLAGKYFTLNDVFNQELYYFWYKVNGVGSDPALTGRTGYLVNIATNDTAQTVATATVAALTTNLLTRLTTTTPSSGIFTITNNYFGPSTAISNGTSGFSHSVITNGALDVLLSTSVSPTLAVDFTSQSLVRVINRNTNENIYAYYLSSSTTAPGEILLEARNLANPKFYVLANTGDTGSSFSPSLSPTYITLSNTAANPTVVTVSNHGFQNGNEVVIVNSNSLPPISGLYTISNVTTNTFTIPVSVATSGSTGSIINASIAEVSDNEVKPNRVYYSKFQQPDAVPVVNTLDIGIENKAILRIFPLRDSLFVFKEDGIYRISGDTAPFTVNLFDSSAILVAADSVDVANNVIYGWTRQGIVSVNESGVSILSRPIDTEVFKLSSNNYTHFPTATWGVGYVSDNSYIVYTVQKTTDTIANIAYRYCSLTNTWTTYDKTNTCGIVNPVDDKLYMGAGDTNFLEIEKKTFTRTDYSDREKPLTLQVGNYLNNGSVLLLLLDNITDINVGDVITQDQLLTVYSFNQLLKKLDTDPGTNDKDYYSTLIAHGGDNLRTDIELLAAKLDSDSGLSIHTYVQNITDSSFTITSNSAELVTVITTSSAHNLINGRIVSITGSNSTPSIDGIYSVTVLSPTTFTIPVDVIVAGTSGTGATLINNFTDIQTCYNKMIAIMNSDPNLIYNNYAPIVDTTTQETIITSVNTFTKKVTVSPVLPFVSGPMTAFEAIECEFLYSNLTMGDPLNWKHIRETQIFFENKAFTSATLSFSTDLIPSYTDVPIIGAGNGIFGNTNFGLGQFGGASNSVPFRTYVPRNAQRCRFVNLKFNHRIAREKYAIFGCSITGEVGQSSRAYK